MSDNEKDKSDAGSGNKGWIITTDCIFSPLSIWGGRGEIERLWLVLSIEPGSIHDSM